MKKILVPVLIVVTLVSMAFVMVACSRDEPFFPQTQCGDFLLTISVNETRFRRGNDIVIHAT